MASREYITQDILTGTNIITGPEYQETMMKIAEVAADLVSTTLGPYGSTTIIDDSHTTYPTKDGYMVLTRLRFNDPIYNNIFRTLRQISVDLAGKVGDGTTSALVAARYFLDGYFEMQKQNPHIRQADILQGLKQASEAVIKTLEETDRVKHIDLEHGGGRTLWQIAEVSSNGNQKLAEIIETIYQETNNPEIYVDTNGGFELGYEIQTGYRFTAKTLFHKGYVNELHGEDPVCRKTTPMDVIIFDHNINYSDHGVLISSLMTYENQRGRELMILAPYYDNILANSIGDSIDSLLKQKKQPGVMMLQVPMSIEAHRQTFSDLVMLTNAKTVDFGKVRAFQKFHWDAMHPGEDFPQKFEDGMYTPYTIETSEEFFEDILGKLNEITVHERYAILQGYESICNKKLFDETVREAKTSYAREQAKALRISMGEVSKEHMDAHQRLIKLSGRMGVIHVGGGSDLEKLCLKDAVDDAVQACKSAYEYGYVRGMNLEVLYTIDHLRDQFPESDPGNAIILDVLNLLHKSFFYLAMQVITNKWGEDKEKQTNVTIKGQAKPMAPYEVINYCVEHDGVLNLLDDSVEEGSDISVINSVRTDIEILRSIVSILSLLITSSGMLSINRMYDREASILYKTKEEEEKFERMGQFILRGIRKESSLPRKERTEEEKELYSEEERENILKDLVMSWGY